MPVITGLATAGICVSVDTMRAEVAEQALARRARGMVNDVSGGLADPDMVAVIAAAGVPYVINHWRGHSADMYGKAVYDDVVADVRAELSLRVHDVIADGVDPGQIIVDPGLGFAKLAEHNWALLASLRDIPVLGGPGSPFPLLFAASRKRFIGRLLAGPDGEPRPFTDSDDATVALTALAAAAGAWCVRVHEVPANADAVRVVARVQQAEREQQAQRGPGRGEREPDEPGPDLAARAAGVRPARRARPRGRHRPGVHRRRRARGGHQGRPRRPMT